MLPTLRFSQLSIFVAMMPLRLEEAAEALCPLERKSMAQAPRAASTVCGRMHMARAEDHAVCARRSIPVRQPTSSTATRFVQGEEQNKLAAITLYYTDC